MFDQVDTEDKIYNNYTKNINKEQWGSAYKDLLNSLLNDTEYTNSINENYIMPYWMINNPNHFEDLGSDQYLIKESLTPENNGWALIYNGKGNDFYWEFMGHSEYAGNTNITNTLKNFFNNYIKSKYTTNPDNNSNLTYD
jgi:hypothetical protein